MCQVKPIHLLMLKRQIDKDISNGLTEALKISVIKSCNNASQENGFYKNDNIKIPFPSKINKVKKAFQYRSR